MKKHWDWMVTKEWLEVTYCFAVSSIFIFCFAPVCFYSVLNLTLPNTQEVKDGDKCDTRQLLLL